MAAPGAARALGGRGAAFLINSDQLEIVEWNPRTMEVTGNDDISALARDGSGYEYRGGELRASGGVLFFI